MRVWRPVAWLTGSSAKRLKLAQFSVGDNSRWLMALLELAHATRSGRSHL